MGDEMTRRERLEAVLAGRSVDRVPVLSGHFNECAEDWKAAEPSYRRLVEFCRARCDGIVSWVPRAVNATGPGTSSPAVRTERRSEPLGGGGTETIQTVHLPGGTLTSRRRRLADSATQWQVEHLMKGPEDAERFLAVPREPVKFDGSTFEVADRRIGEAGLVLLEMADAFCLAAEMFDFGTFTVVALTEPELFTRLLDYFHAYALEFLEAALSSGPLKFVRIFGPEYASAPLLPLRLFDPYVTAYDREYVERIHRAGARVRIHCHGRVRGLLEKFAAWGADATDPVEPPPSGDITLAEAKRLVGDRLTIFGNLELRDLETLSRDEVVCLTRRTLEEGMPGGRFALQPSAEPIGIPLSAQLEENWMAYISTGLELGRY
jgi:uroporphyrinogen-III decarboxylase